MRSDPETSPPTATSPSRSAGQAVANVIRSAPDLPWWRITPSDGRLHRTHAPTQQPLLESEGHTIDADRRVTAGPESNGPA